MLDKVSISVKKKIHDRLVKLKDCWECDTWNKLFPEVLEALEESGYELHSDASDEQDEDE